MDVVIVNTSKLRVALNNCAKSKGYKSITALFTANSISSSVIKKAEDRFLRYQNRVSFPIDIYTAYGAIYEDMWEQICDVSGIKRDDLECGRITGDKGGNLKGLEHRVEELESMVASLKLAVDDLRKELGVD